MEKRLLITVARQYGSGGREIGTRLAELLGIPLYDHQLIEAAAAAGDLHPEVAERVDERAAGSLLYTFAMGAGLHTTAGGYTHMPVNDRLFHHQCEYIKARAAEGSGVFIGRCADYVLREDPARFSVFIYAPLEARRLRVAERHPELREGSVLDLINKTDRRRASYYGFYTGGKWGRYENYHLAVDSSVFGIEGSARLIAEAVARRG
jgi:cytidylate kinase